MSEHGAMSITYGATEAQRHGERTEWQRLTGDDSTRRREAATAGREKAHVSLVETWSMLTCAFSQPATRPAPQARPRRILCVSVPLWLRTLIVIAAAQAVVHAHSGPPFPILSDQIAGAYRISIWADPDATDDGSAAGQFWVMLQPVRPDAGPAIPPGTRVEVVIRPLDRPGAVLSGRAAPVNADPARQFVALLMDHEGPFGVRVTVDGPLGAADAQASTDATYDLRPRPILLVLFVLPFVLVGFVWGKLLIRRRMQRPGGR